METAYLVAANWWANAIAARRQLDNGDPLQSQIATVLRASRGDVTISALQKQVFISYLISEIKDLASGARQVITLSCDYDPDPALQNALEKAKITHHNLPWKTCMKISKDCVEVAEGYNADSVIIWPTK